MNTDSGIYKICENLWNLWENKSQAAEGISHRCQGAKESPTDSTDEHGYWVRRCVPQIAQRSTDIGIYKICENLWNLWENKSQAAEGISHRYRRLTRILGAKENTNLYNYTNINLKVIKICENPWNPWENNLKMHL